MTRRRQFLCAEIRCLANRGHGQVAEYCHEKLPHRWWGPRTWKKVCARFEPWMVGVLEKLREIILVIGAQVTALLAELALRVAGQPRPKKLGSGRYRNPTARARLHCVRLRAANPAWKRKRKT